MTDQKELWDSKHAKGEHAAFRGVEMPFTTEALSFFPTKGKILEIGCGVGADAARFAELGYDVLATDLSDVVIRQNKEHFASSSARFEQLDVTELLPYENNAFDVVYSHLALHYYDDEMTRKVFAELGRVLKPGGIFAFACKSVHDPRYGQGEQAGPDIFLGKGGHIRHFFSVEYAKNLLGDDYDVRVLKDVREEYNDDASAFVQCIAAKR